MGGWSGGRPWGAPFTSHASRLTSSAEDAQDVRLFHDDQVVAVDLHFRARPLAEQDAVAGLQFQSVDLAGFVTNAGADGADFAFLRLFLGGVGDDDPALGLGFFFNALNQHAVAERTKRHRFSPYVPPDGGDLKTVGQPPFRSLFWQPTDESANAIGS